MDRDAQSILDEIKRIKEYYAKKQIIISTHLWMSDLRGAYLQNFDMRKMWFSCSNLKGSKMSGADLSGAIFAPYKRPENHLLCAAILNDVDLENATLIGTRLEGVDLRNTNIQTEQINDACIDSFTELPIGTDKKGMDYHRVKNDRIDVIIKNKLCEEHPYIIKKFLNDSL